MIQLVWLSTGGSDGLPSPMGEDSTMARMRPAVNPREGEARTAHVECGEQSTEVKAKAASGARESTSRAGCAWGSYCVCNMRQLKSRGAAVRGDACGRCAPQACDACERCAPQARCHGGAAQFVKPASVARRAVR